MQKYNLNELEALDVLPDDCNAGAEEFAATFKDPVLMTQMTYFRQKKLTDGYGKVTVFENGVPIVVFKFTFGVCVHAIPVVWFDAKHMNEGSIKFY